MSCKENGAIEYVKVILEMVSHLKDETLSVSVLWVRMNSFIFLVPRMKTAIATLNQGFQTFKGAFM